LPELQAASQVPEPVSVNTERLRACPLCGGVRLRLWRRGWDRSHRLSEQRFTYSRCARCGVRFESMRPREEDAHRFYPETYYDPRRPEHQPLSPADARARLHSTRDRRFVRWLTPLNDALARVAPDPLPGRLARAYARRRDGAVLLDYGCGSPAFLDWARTRGWQTVGLDVSDRVLEEVREAGHRALSADPQSWQALDDGSVELARMNHVVEHLYRPREVLSALSAKLAPGGTLHLSTPNPRSIGSIALRSRWLGLDCPRHVMLYPPRVLAALLHEIGFSRVETFHEVLTKDLVRSVGHLLHDMGRIRHDEILAMADREAPAVALYAPMRLAAACRVSDRFHCFAQK
jgi:2-polyprenyl-3-methyl-5-hydroxy-6-metoxy-1,4-benzoquinol methylase